MRSVRYRLEHVCDKADSLYSTLSKDEMNALYFACLADLLHEGNASSIEQLMRQRGAPEHVIRHYVDEVFASLIIALERVYEPPDYDSKRVEGSACA